MNDTGMKFFPKTHVSACESISHVDSKILPSAIWALKDEVSIRPTILLPLHTRAHDLNCHSEIRETFVGDRRKEAASLRPPIDVLGP